MEKNEEEGQTDTKDQLHYDKDQKKQAYQQSEQVDALPLQDYSLDVEQYVEHFKQEAHAMTIEHLPQLLHMFIAGENYLSILKSVVAITRLLRKNKIQPQIIDVMGGQLLRMALCVFIKTPNQPKNMLPHLLKFLKLMLCIPSWRQFFLEQEIIQFSCYNLHNFYYWLDVLEALLIQYNVSYKDLQTLIDTSHHIESSTTLSRLAILICTISDMTSQVKYFLLYSSTIIPNDYCPLYCLYYLLAMDEVYYETSLLLERLLTTDNLNMIYKISVLRVYNRVYTDHVDTIKDKIKNVDMLPAIKRCLEDGPVGRYTAIYSLRIYLTEDADRGQSVMLDQHLVYLLLQVLVNSSSMYFHLDFWSMVMIFIKRVDGRVLIPVLLRTSLLSLLSFLIIYEDFRRNDIGLTILQNVIRKVYRSSSNYQWELFKIWLYQHSIFDYVSCLGYDKDPYTGMERRGSLASMAAYIRKMKTAYSLPLVYARERRVYFMEYEKRRKRLGRRGKTSKKIERRQAVAVELHVQLPPEIKKLIEEEEVYVFNLYLEKSEDEL